MILKSKMKQQMEFTKSLNKLKEILKKEKDKERKREIN